ncbi:MAG: hypothetical protein ACMUEL_06200 [Flavobacteriales bacterium Tduv]
MYQPSPQLKKLAYILIIIGGVLLVFGFYQGFSINFEEAYNFIQEHPLRFVEDHYPAGFTTEEVKQHQTEHTQHLLHQVHSRPWSALYTAAFYFTGLSLGVLFFLAIQHTAQAGWSIVVSRVMESIASFLPYGGVILLIVLILNAFGLVHMFHWMDPSLFDLNSPNYDELIANKEPFLNKFFYIIRSVVYLVGWTFFLCWMKRLSKKLDETHSVKDHNKLHDVSVGFIAFFAMTSMVMGWDWIMSLDPHWFSTLFGWYVLGTYLVTGITTIALVALYLKDKGFLPKFNDNHLHDLAKYMFATSLLWSYLWFTQFLLYWYGNIPEEVAYFINRAEQYNNIHFWMLIPNLVLPLFGLIGSNFKRNPRVVITLGCIILIGHYIDVYNMIMVGSVGGFYGFGAAEIGALLLIAGLFILIVAKELSTLELEAKGNQLFRESEIYEYPY